ncbi:MAG: helix-turn-helix transcriptional regulator [Cetobacterium sp.]|uniref:helix-turn-helix domain-containing protein n=1 Tax=Bacteria TaxID=2 RepID=UPI002FC5EFE1
MKNNFSKNIKKLRKNKRLTQQDVSDGTGIARSTLSFYESGSSEPDLYNLIKLATFYQCSIDELVYKEPLSEDDLLIPNFITEFDIDSFSHEKLINNLNNKKKYYLDFQKRMNKEIPLKISEIDKLIELIKTTDNKISNDLSPLIDFE